MENNNSKSSVVYQGKIPGRVKYSFAFGALGKDLIYGMIATFSMIYFLLLFKLAQMPTLQYSFHMSICACVKIGLSRLWSVVTFLSFLYRTYVLS